MKATRGQSDRSAENPATEQQQTGYHGGGEGGQNHGKKSVLKKVKEKAKKLKVSTIGKKKHREGEGGPPHKGEVREHGLPPDYMEEEEEVHEEIEEEDEEGNFSGADPPPGKVREKMGGSEPSVAIRPGVYKPPDSEPQPAGDAEKEADAPEPGRRGAGDGPFDEDPDAGRSEPAVVSPDISEAAAEQKPVASEGVDQLGPVLESIKDMKFGEEFQTGSHDQFAPEPPAEWSASELSGSDVAVEAKPASLTEKVASAKDAIASMVHPKRDDEGVSATKYVMEKLSPGEEERALSEVIKDAIHAATKVGDRDGGETGAEAPEADAGGNRRRIVEKVKEVAISMVGKDQSHDGGHQASGLAGGEKSAEERELQESTI
ncbi:unnamed protein product [Victoria cruziana]